KESEIPKAARGLLDRLVEKRLLVRSSRQLSDGTGTETTIEVAHEAILRHWQTLRRILDRKSSELRAIQAAEQAATVWQRQERKAEWLDHKGERLLSAESLTRNPAYAGRLSGLPAEYLRECRKVQDRAEHDRLTQLEARERAQKRAQLSLLGLIALALALLLGAGWQMRQTARREARVFDSLASKAISEENYQRAMRLALQGLPPLGSLPMVEWARELEATLARSARLSRIVFVLRPPGGAITHVAMSPDGKRMVTSHVDKLCRIWDVASGREVGRLRGHDDAVLDARFGANGQLLVTASQDGTARVWEAATQQ